jgi:hypothetical protein
VSRGCVCVWGRAVAPSGQALGNSEYLIGEDVQDLL